MTDQLAAQARRALRLLDLTDLSDSSNEAAIEKLCMQARTPHGPVAAVCIWPQHVKLAAQRLTGSGVRIATVVNFPAGTDKIARVLADVEESLGDGADDIDLVLPYRDFLRGETEIAGEYVGAVSDMLGDGKVLKVILETGAYPDQASVAAASRLAIESGADFIKTSTGKTTVSATPDAVRTMLHAIRDSGADCGIKPSGGIRSLEDAMQYLDLADSIMGAQWASPRTFRFGASSLFDALLAVIEGRGHNASDQGY
ncbi:MAG: deoxyribose-phosphate aldolase [Beijerinckiaceae bacterium]